MLQITAVAIVCAIIVVYLKSVNSELAFLALVGSGIILLFIGFSYLADAFDFINNIVEMTKIDGELYAIIFKITVIGYLVEFGAGMIEDFGLKSIADKLVFCGKIIILTVSLPILYSVINLLTEILG